MKTFGVLAFIALAIGFLMLIWFGSAILKTFCCPSQVTSSDPESGQVDPTITESRDRIDIPGVWDRPPDYFEAIFDFPKPKQNSKIEPKEKQPPNYPTTELYKNTPYFHRSISAPNFQKKWKKMQENDRNDEILEDFQNFCLHLPQTDLIFFTAQHNRLIYWIKK